MDSTFNSTFYTSCDVISNEPSWNTVGEGWKQFLGWTDTEGGTTVKYSHYPEQEGSKTIPTLGKETINLYAVFEKRVLVDFNNPTKVILKNVTANDCRLSKCCNYSFECASGYERLYIPVYNLDNDSWYKITFNITLTHSGWTDSGKGSFGTTFKDKTTVSGGTDSPKSKLRNNVEKNTKYMQYHQFSENASSPYTPTEDITMYIYKGSNPVYWAWDLSRLANGSHNLKISVSNIEKVTNSSSDPYVNLFDPTFSDGYSFAYPDATTPPQNPYMTYISDVMNGSGGFLEYNGATKTGYERVHIPIKNFHEESTYKVSFSVSVNRDPYNTGDDRCYGFDTSNAYIGGTNLHDKVETNRKYSGQQTFVLNSVTNLWELNVGKDDSISYKVPKGANDLYFVVCLSGTGNNDLDVVKISNVVIYEQ